MICAPVIYILQVCGSRLNAVELHQSLVIYASRPQVAGTFSAHKGILGGVGPLFDKVTVYPSCHFEHFFSFLRRSRHHCQHSKRKNRGYQFMHIHFYKSISMQFSGFLLRVLWLPSIKGLTKSEFFSFSIVFFCFVRQRNKKKLKEQNTPACFLGRGAFSHYLEGESGFAFTTFTSRIFMGSEHS